MKRYKGILKGTSDSSVWQLQENEYVTHDDHNTEITELVNMLEDVVQDIYDDERRYRIDALIAKHRGG